MEKPEHTPNCVAQVLEGCWKADPNQRPTFGQIEELLDGPLESFVTSFYLQLNEDYQRLNFDKRTYENFSVKPDHSTGHGQLNDKIWMTYSLACIEMANKISSA